jgi:hypothetical protein
LLVHGKNFADGKSVHCEAWGNRTSASKKGRNKKNYSVSVVSACILNPLKKVPYFVQVQSVAIDSFESLPEHRMWSSAPSPSAMEILLIRIRISRFLANLELEKVIWGRRMQNKMLNDSLPFNKGKQAQPPLPRKSWVGVEEIV